MKKFLILACATLLGASAAAAVSCGEDKTSQFKSELFGRFEYSTERNVALTNDNTLTGTSFVGNDNKTYTYMYTSDVYPLNTIDNEGGIVYSSSQSLRLTREATYTYTYSIQLSKVEVTGNTDIAKIEVETAGTFTYESIDETNFSVTLSDPTDGSEDFYGASVTGEDNIYSFRLGNTPAYQRDLSFVAEGGFDRYSKGRTVTVEKGEERVLKDDDIFFADLFNDIAAYYSYVPDSGQSAGGEDGEEQPDTPGENTPVQAVADSAIMLSPDFRNGIGIAVGADCAAVMDIYVDKSVSSVTVNGGTHTDVTEDEQYRKYRYGLDFSQLGDTFTVTADGASRTFSPADYLLERADVPAFGGETSQMNELSAQAFAVSLLNYARTNGADVTLSPEQEAMVYPSNGVNYYHTDWGARDNLTGGMDGTSAVQGFSWGGVPALCYAEGASLEYKFNVPAGTYANLRAKVQTGETEYWTEVTGSGSTDQNEEYTFVTGIIPVSQYEQTVRVTVYDGESAVSDTVGYSVNRAIAWADVRGEQADKDAAKALYSLAKAGAWVLNADEIAYCLNVPFGGGNASYAFSILNYDYSLSYAAEAYTPYDASGAALYVGGEVVSAAQTRVSNDVFTAEMSGNAFTVTLHGGSIDAIAPANSNAISRVDIVVEGDTVVSGTFAHQFFVNTGDVSIALTGDIGITGASGATLTVRGGIQANNLTIEGACVLVENATDNTAVNCGALTVGGQGSLTVCATELTGANAKAVAATGDITLDGGSLSVTGYDNGIELNGDGNQKLVVQGEAELYIEAEVYGITGTAPVKDDAPVNRQFSFLGGESYIRAANGVKYADISVGDASLTVIADNGFTVESEDATRPVSFSTTGGSYNVGNVVLVNNTYNPYWDVNYTLKAGSIDINGGTISIFGMCKDGVVKTYNGAKIDIHNADVTVQSGQNLEDSYGRAFNMEQGDEVLTVYNDAKLIVKNCDVAVACWGKGTDEQSAYAQLVNHGLIILDTFKCSLESWELGAWMNNLTVENDGQIRTTNRLS